jgi:hypothetical protein
MHKCWTRLRRNSNEKISLRIKKEEFLLTSIFWLKDKAARDKAIWDPIITLEVVLYDYGA